MKKKILVNIALSCAAALSAFGIAGAEALAYDAATDYIIYSGLKSTVDISAKIGSASNQAVTLVITRDLPDEFTYDGDDTLTDFVRTGENGEVKYTVNIPSGFSSGRYRVYLFGRDEAIVEIPYFAHINTQSIKALIASVNLAKSKAEMSELVADNAATLVIDGDYTENELKSIGETLYSLKEVSGGYSASEPTEFLNDFNLAKAIAEIKSGREVSSVLKKYASYFEIDYDSDYLLLTDDVRRFLDTLLAEADYSGGDVPLMYQELKVYSMVKKAASYQKMQTVVEEERHFKLIDPDTRYYDKLKDKSAVYRKMAENISDINCFDDIADVFYKASEAVYDDINGVKADSGKGGGGGGSSKGGSSAVSLPLDVESNVGQQAPQNPPLTDISGHWAQNEITSLAAAGVVSGYSDGSFRPDNTVTRAEFVKLIVSAFSIESGSAASFDDVSSSDWHQPYISAAAGAGIVKGVSDSLFEPDSFITRQDAALMIYRLVSEDTAFGAPSAFADGELISAYARDAVSALAANGIITGFEDSTFRPVDNITRAQAAVIISRALKGGRSL